MSEGACCCPIAMQTLRGRGQPHGSQASENHVNILLEICHVGHSATKVNESQRKSTKMDQHPLVLATGIWRGNARNDRFLILAVMARQRDSDTGGKRPPP